MEDEEEVLADELMKVCGTNFKAELHTHSYKHQPPSLQLACG